MSLSRRRIDIILAIVLGVGYLLALLATSHDYAMVWDEGHTVRREQTLELWFGKIAKGEVASAFSARELERSWPFSREEPDGHPPFYALLGLAGWWLTRGIFSPLTAYRLGPMVLASATVGVVYLHLANRRGRAAGLVAAGALALLPHVFSLSHYAHYDMPVTCLWLLAQMAFLNALRSSRWIIPFGVSLGLAAGTKFTGGLAVLAPVAWVVLFEWLPTIHLIPPQATSEAPAQRRFPGTRILILGGLVAACTLYAIQPAWWFSPVGGMSRFIASNLSRAKTKPIPTLYLGEFYPFALPWHNTIVLTAVSVPVVTLLLGISGIYRSVTRRPSDREGILWVLSWGVLMVVRALPMTPGHDGVRLFLPSLGSLAILAGIGAETWLRWLKRLNRRWLAAVLILACWGEGALGIAQLYPFTLSYYNAAIGGLKGAEKAGFELTYYWDTMGQDFFRWVRKEKRTRPLELRFPSSLINIYFLREWGELPKDVPVVGIDREAKAGDYVLQTRRGHFYPYDWWLDKNGRASLVIRRQGVDLLRVYPHEEALKAFMETRNEPYPEHLREWATPGF